MDNSVIREKKTNPNASVKALSFLRRVFSSPARAEPQHSPLFPTQFRKSWPHVVPFRIVFDEYLHRRPAELKLAVEQFIPNGSGSGSAIEKLKRQIKASEDAYKALQIAKDQARDFADEERSCHEADVPLKKIIHALEGSALCLSGGGIRSAGFCLGVLEGLARFSRRTGANAANALLDNLDYLSTVSGGGYIGSWLMAWVSRVDDAGRRNPSAGAIGPAANPELPSVHNQAQKRNRFTNAVDALAGNADVPSGDPEPQPVRHLRDYTSFLAPKLGLTLDSFTLAAIVGRNLFVTWVMLLPVFAALLALPLFSYDLVSSLANWGFPIAPVLLIAGEISLLACAMFAGVCRPLGDEADRVPPELRKDHLTLALLAAGIFLISESWLVEELKSEWQYRFELASKPGVIVIAFALISFTVVARSIWRRYCDDPEASSTTKKYSVWRRLGQLAMFVVATAAVAGATVGLLWLSAYWLRRLGDAHGRGDYRLVLILAAPAVGAILMFGSSLLSGLLGDYEQEEAREWWARAGGFIFMLVAGWVAAHGAVLYAPSGWARGLSFAGAPLGVLTSLLGWSQATAAGTGTAKTGQLGALGKFLLKHNLLVPLASAAALAFIFLGLARLEQWLVHWSIPREIAPRELLTTGAVIAVCALVACLANWAIDINTFSLHGMYRMRLARAFLGASNLERRPDPFTHFDPEDSRLHEKDLPYERGVPLHVINTTLNLVATKNLAWRQRKAEPFSFSPLHCGSWRRGYASTKIYAGQQGVTLATAMAISGAAFNPNMGYHSSPLVTLLMTIFNARLGWWVPNPGRAGTDGNLTPAGRRFLGQNSPSFGLWPLMREALGLTNDDDCWVELTDGGHFENLGLYEMVMRRCRTIIVVDATADPECHFEDLGNALRKIEIDLGIPISFSEGMRMTKGQQPANRYCAVGTIVYSSVDKAPDGWKAPNGTLVYIKAGLNGTEPPDIQAYSFSHPSFPHESTANQFFNESQFESYRHLGSHAIEQIANASGWSCRSHAQGANLLTKAAQNYSSGSVQPRQAPHSRTRIASALMK
ncbi:MAG: hypothetical protein ACRD2B_05875 [Terriglobia bacterium]